MDYPVHINQLINLLGDSSAMWVALLILLLSAAMVFGGTRGKEVETKNTHQVWSKQDDPVAEKVAADARDLIESSPHMAATVRGLILAQAGLEGSIAAVVAARLADPEFLPRSTLQNIMLTALLAKDASGDLEGTGGDRLRADLEAIVVQDPACDSLLEPILYFKGFQALQAHRAAHQLWDSGDRHTALWIQSRCSAIFGLDIHPAARIAGGLLLDHGTGVVIGATATVGPGCSFLHGITLGASGKDGDGDRHPKVGAGVLIGANASILGNIRIGDGAKIGAGAVVLKPIPPKATAAGIPAKIVGRQKVPEATPEPATSDVATEEKSTEVRSERGGSCPISRWWSGIGEKKMVDQSLDGCNGKFQCIWSHFLDSSDLRNHEGRVTFYDILNAFKKFDLGYYEASTLFFNLDVEQKGSVTLEELKCRFAGAVKDHPEICCSAKDETEFLRAMCSHIEADTEKDKTRTRSTSAH